jgi:hypothetical protein
MSNEMMYFSDVELFAIEEARIKILTEFDIAHEIYLAKNWNTIHYADLMDNVPEGTASKSTLISWLNNNTRNGNVIRPGVISFYKKECKNHFKDGNWKASRLHEFIMFVAQKLTSPEFVGDKKRSSLFSDSFRNHDWFAKAVAVCGLKLMEDCYLNKALKSKVAMGYLELTFNARRHYEDMGKIVGRCSKNHDLSYEFQREIQSSIETYLKKSLQKQLEISDSHQEHKIFEKWEPKIRRDLNLIPDNLSQQLLLNG